jgi:hypothetical protein
MKVVMNFTVVEKGPNDPSDKQSEIVAEIYQPIEILTIHGVRKRLYLFQKFFFGPLLFGGRRLENFVPTGTAGISIISRSI